MQIVSKGDNLHGTSKSIFYGKNMKNIIHLSSAEYAKSGKVNLLKTKIRDPGVA